MYKANQEFLFNDILYKENDKIENPTRRMIELGIVSFYYEDDVIKQEVNEETETKPKQSKKKKTEQTEQTEQILTEISDEVVVEIQTDDSE